MRHRKVLALSPAEYEQGKPPSDSSGIFGGEYFEEGVSRTMPYPRAATFAAEGYVALPPDEADKYVERVRNGDDEADSSEESSGDVEPPEEVEAEETAPTKPDVSKEDIEIGDSAVEEKESDDSDTIPDADVLQSSSAPEGYEEREDVPSYHEQLTELSEAGVSPREVFGGQPKKEDLLALHCAWKEGVGALVERGD